MKVSGITFQFLLATLFVFVKYYDDVPRLSAALLQAVASARVMCEQQQQVEDQVRIIPA